MGGISWSRARRGLIVSLAGLLVGVGCTDGPAEPSASAPDRLVFVRNDTLMVVNIDGTDERVFSRAAEIFREPLLSPDGQSIIVNASARFGCGKFLELALDGSVKRTLNTGDWCVFRPHLSRDGERIAFLAQAHDFEAPPPHIAVMNLDGSGMIDLSSLLPPPAAGCNAPAPPKVTLYLMGWISASRLQMQRHVCGLGTSSFAINVDGSNITQTYTGILSPDGSRTVRGGTELAITDVANGAKRILAQYAVVEGSAGGTYYSPWSADGSHLLYRQHSGGYIIAKTDGSGETSVPRMPPLSTPWGFAGRHDRLLYTEWYAAGEQSTWTLYVLTNDGSDPVPLSVGKGSVTHVTFLPGR